MELQQIFWLVALVLLIALEGMTMGLVSIWFALGSLSAMIASLLGGPLWLQIVLFFGVSALSLALTRPFARKILSAQTVRTNSDRNIGMTGQCVEAVSNEDGTGAVKLGGKVWTARTADGSLIAEGSTVRVTSIEGVKLIVTAEK